MKRTLLLASLLSAGLVGSMSAAEAVSRGTSNPQGSNRSTSEGSRNTDSRTAPETTRDGVERPAVEETSDRVPPQRDDTQNQPGLDDTSATNPNTSTNPNNTLNGDGTTTIQTDGTTGVATGRDSRGNRIRTTTENKEAVKTQTIEGSTPSQPSQRKKTPKRR